MEAIFFAGEEALLRHYFVAVGDRLSDEQGALLSEVAHRLRAAGHCLCRAEASAESSRLAWRGEMDGLQQRHLLAPTHLQPPTDAQRALMQYNFESRMYAEAFYYFASRLQKILTSKKRPFPHLSFEPVIGIQKVRNHLLEHPEGADSGVFVGGTQVASEPFDVWLKVPIAINQSPKVLDPGLIGNASALRAHLNAALRLALSAITNGQTV